MSHLDMESAKSSPAGHVKANRQPLARLRTGLWAALALVVTILFGGPTLYLILNRISPMVTANEAVAYVYFAVVRLQEGGERFVFLPHGHSIGLLHHAINAAMTHGAGLSPSDLRTRFDVFFAATGLTVTALVGLVLLAALTRRYLLWSDKLLLAVVALGVIYGSTNGGYYYQTAYYTLEIALVVVAVAVYLVHLRTDPPAHPIRRAAAIGCLLGLLGATKVTLPLTGAFMLWPTLMAPPLSRREFARRLVVAGAAAGATLLLIVWAYYLFDPTAVVKFLRVQASFVRNPGNVQPGFWEMLMEDLGGLWRSGYLAGVRRYGYAWILFPGWILTVATLGFAAWRRRAERGFAETGLVFLIAGMGAIHLIGLVRRPAGTTLFEVGLFMLTSIAVCAVTFTRPGRRPVSSIAFVVLAGLYTAAGAHSGIIDMPLETMKHWDRSVWEIHHWLRDQRRPVVVYFPENNFTAGTVEAALLKGLSDVPTWEITEGRRTLERVAPGFSFTQDLDEVPEGAIILWTELKEYEPLDETNLLLRWATRTLAAPRRRWTFSGHTAHVCILPPGVTPNRGDGRGACRVAFVGTAEEDVVGDGSSFGANGQRDVCFRVTLNPGEGGVQLHAVRVYSSTATGTPDGGGRWDTDHAGHRALAIRRGNEILNADGKRPLDLEIRETTTLDLLLDDGGMTASGRHFTIRLVHADGTYFQVTLAARPGAGS